MKTRDLFIGLGIAAGALLTVTALNRNNTKVKKFINDKIRQVKQSNKNSKDKDINYV